MESCVANSAEPQAVKAAREVIGKIKTFVSKPKLILLYVSTEIDIAAARSALESEFTGVPLIGISSSEGVIAPDRYFDGDGAFLCALAIGGKGIDVGVAASGLAGNSRETGKLLARKAMADAGRQDAPDFWFMLSSSCEANDCMNGIGESIGVVPLCGGGVAEAESKVFTSDGLFQKGAAIAFVYSKAQVVTSFAGCLGEQATDAIQDALRNLKARRVPPVPRAIKVHLSGVVAANPAVRPPVMYAMVLDERLLPTPSDGRMLLADQLDRATEEAPFMVFLAKEEYGMRDGSYRIVENGLSFASIG